MLVVGNTPPYTGAFWILSTCGTYVGAISYVCG